MFNYNLSLRISLLLFVIILAIFFFYINTKITNQIRTELNNQVQTVVNEYHNKVLSADDNTVLEVLLPLIDELNIPMVIKTQEGNGAFSYEHLNINIPFEKNALEYKIKIEEIISTMDQTFEPLTIIEVNKVPLIQIHYGDTKLINTIKWVPYIESAFALILLILIFAGYRVINISEKNLIYAGMAKETAHQLGTPISSLMGWIDLLKTEPKNSKNIIEEIEKEVARLENISHKFNKIGSTPSLIKINLIELLSDLISYYESRIPKSKNITINLIYKENLYVRGDYVLLYWSIENLIKNSIDSIKNKYGKIDIELIAEDDLIKLIFSDNGIGIKGNNKKKIFKPGYSTKNRGWGLGLSLSKRIIENLHHGSIRVIKSKNTKTTFLITFKNFYS